MDEAPGHIGQRGTAELRRQAQNMSATMTMHRHWNANTHYHSLVFASLPPGVSRVLDVGCGDGMLTAELVDAGVPHVVGLDADGPVLARARARHLGKHIEWVHGDVFEVALEPESFDAVAARSLEHFARLVRPGGTVVVVGLAATAWADLPLTAAAYLARGALSLIQGWWEHSAPTCWPPPVTFREMQRVSARVLPGVRYRRHLLGRYSLVWRKPRSAASDGTFPKSRVDVPSAQQAVATDGEGQSARAHSSARRR